MQILKQMVKRPENMKNTLKNQQNFIPRKLKKQNKILQKNQEGVKVEPASKLSLVSGNYLQPKVPDGVDLASAEAEIRHVFGDTPITEASIGAAPPGNNIAQWELLRSLDSCCQPLTMAQVLVGAEFTPP